jgi:hypothetical protein
VEAAARHAGDAVRGQSVYVHETRLSRPHPHMEQECRTPCPRPRLLCWISCWPWLRNQFRIGVERIRRGPVERAIRRALSRAVRRARRLQLRACFRGDV